MRVVLSHTSHRPRPLTSLLIQRILRGTRTRGLPPLIKRLIRHLPRLLPRIIIVSFNGSQVLIQVMVVRRRPISLQAMPQTMLHITLILPSMISHPIMSDLRRMLMRQVIHKGPITIFPSVRGRILRRIFNPLVPRGRPNVQRRNQVVHRVRLIREIYVRRLFIWVTRHLFLVFTREFLSPRVFVSFVQVFQVQSDNQSVFPQSRG